MPINRRTARLPKSHSFIKANSLIILFIDIGCHFWMKREAVLHEGSTNTDSAPGGINEKRFHVPAVDQHERQRVVIFINSQPEWCVGKETAHHFINSEAILRR